MTDFTGPPLTRKERKERERALAEATGSAAPIDASQPEAPQTDAPQPDASQPDDAAVDPRPVDDGARWTAAGSTPAPSSASIDPGETQAIDVSELIADLRPASAASSAPESVDVSEVFAVADADRSDDSRTPIDAVVVEDAPVEDAPVEAVPADAEPAFEVELPDEAPASVDERAATEATSAPTRPAPAKGGFGRFFGRRDAVADDAVADGDAVVVAEPIDEQATQTSGTVAAERPDAEAGDRDEPETIEAVFADLQPDRVMPVPPARTATGSIPRIQVEDLDPVDDDEVDRVEIDEVEILDRRPVSSRRIAESTPAELEDRRALVEEPSVVVDLPTGPTRATGRMPVVVNVVEDTSQHHIADLRQDTGALSASSVGTGTSAITANALVLPQSGANEPITVETADGVIVTGSIDLPDGFASSGRSRGSIDTSDVDAVDDAGEVRSPETQPVRASRAVSSYANARVRIAPQRRSRNAWPVVLGVGGGVVTLGIVGVAAAFLLNWI